MRTSDAGVDAIKQYEKLRLDAYLDGGGVWTIGYGHTGDVHCEDTITEFLAEQLLEADLGEAEHAIEMYVDVDLTQNQYDALVSFIFNIGVNGFHGSTLLRLLNNGDYAGAAKQFPRWCKDNGVTVRGLLNRRNSERKMFEGVA